MVPCYKSAVLTKFNKELTISWNNVFIHNDREVLQALMIVGSDITDQENASQQIQQLKIELEKENIMLKGEVLPAWLKQEIIGQSKAIK